MDSSSDQFHAGKRSPRREIQGPRPSPLKIHKDSHKIKKPPPIPSHLLHEQPSQMAVPSHHQQQQQQHRRPVIIYTVSPKVIHTDANDFMKLVQRLTGPSSSSSSVLPPLPPPRPPSQDSQPSLSIMDYSDDAISPAARLASIERINNSSHGIKLSTILEDSIVEGLGMSPTVERYTTGPGILSPVPSSLPPISPNFFSPSLDQNSFSFLHDFNFSTSPILSGYKNYIEGNFFQPSPTTNFPSTLLASPSPSFDLFNHFLDL